MKARQITVATCLAVTAWWAQPAAAGPGCPLISDATGDFGRGGFGHGTFSSGTHSDIVSADIASDATTVTTVVRFTAIEPATNADHSLRAAFTFYVHGQLIYTSALQHTSGAATFEVTAFRPNSTGQVFPATGVVDHTNNELRVHFAVSDISSIVTISPGDVFSNLAASGSARHHGVVPTLLVVSGPNYFDVAHAPSGTTYTSNSAGCVTPGV